MEEGGNDDLSLVAKLGTKQRIERAKLRAAERIAREDAARRAEQASITPSRSPFPSSPLITNSLSSTSNHASTASTLLRSPTTNDERVERADALEALSKKIDRAGNFKLQELIMRMILKCPGAKEVAESFLALRDVEDNSEEEGERKRDDAAQIEDTGVHGDSHVLNTRGHGTSITSNADQYREVSLETQAPSESPTSVSNQLIGEANARQEYDTSNSDPALRPERSSISHYNETANQPCTLERRSHCDSVNAQGLSSRQSLPILNSNSQKYPTTIDGEGLATTAIQTTMDAFPTPNNGTLREVLSSTDISKAPGTILSGVAKACEKTVDDNSMSATPEISISRASESATTSVTTDTPQDDMLQLVNDISVRYLALARASGLANFPYEQLAGFRSGFPHNLSTEDFSFEAFNDLVDNFRRNIESMHEAYTNNDTLGNVRSQEVREDLSGASDLGSPIPIGVNGQELDENLSHIDGVNPKAGETTATAEATDIEEDEYGIPDDMPSSHYNCDSCRKPIVLPEGSIVSLSSIPTTCLHCKTRKAAGITRERLGMKSRSAVVAEPPSLKTSNQPSPNQLDQSVIETSLRSSRPVAETSASLSETPLEAPPESLPEPLTEPLLESLREPLTDDTEQLSHSIEVEDNDFGETPRGSGLGHRDLVKEEHQGDDVTVELPAWPSSAIPCLSASQVLADSQISSISRKRKVEYIDGEAIYSHPIGPKRRRGRPLKNYRTMVLDASPTDSSQASTPSTATSRGISRVGLSGKKRGRPFGSKNKVKLEKIDSNQAIDSTETGQRQPAKKTREITRNASNEGPDSIGDAAVWSGVPAQTQINSCSATESTISYFQGSSDRVVSTTRARQDSDPDYTPTWESEVRSGTIPNGDSTLSSLGGAVSNVGNESGAVDNTLTGSLEENLREPGSCNPQGRSSEDGCQFMNSSHRSDMDVVISRQDREVPVSQSSIPDHEQSRLSLAGALPWNTLNQDPSLTALPTPSPTVQGLQEHAPIICRGKQACRRKCKCEKKRRRRQLQKQKRQKKLLAKKNGGKDTIT
ncbi:hypothetical protein ACHAO1_003377 [Botrytis cinerea]